MDIQFRAVANHSDLTETPFEPGDEVVSFLYQSPNGLIERSDVLASEVSQFSEGNKVICRWRHWIRKKDESEAEAKKYALQSAEEMFLSLFDEESSSVDEDNLSEEVLKAKATLKYFISLHLERKRILKPAGKGHVRHVKLKKIFKVSEVAINDETLMSLQAQLDNLVI